MAVRVVIDISEDDLAEIAQDQALAMAFLNAVHGMRTEQELTKGKTASAHSEVIANGRIETNGYTTHRYSFNYGCARYKDDQIDIVARGVNGSSGECFVRQASPSTPKK